MRSLAPDIPPGEPDHSAFHAQRWFDPLRASMIR
jgi:hypothetical protein